MSFVHFGYLCSSSYEKCTSIHAWSFICHCH
jgi:hypothetical protein